MSGREAGILYDIIVSCEEIGEIIEGWTIDDFARQRVQRLAVERLLITCGEAVSRLLRLNPELTGSWKTNPRVVIGLRNFVTHEYDRIDIFVVFNAAQNASMQLLTDARKSLAGIDRP
ncbi:MAG: DUF86 domain-containing protein [Coriobacteriia bacterium]